MQILLSGVFDVLGMPITKKLYQSGVTLYENFSVSFEFYPTKFSDGYGSVLNLVSDNAVYKEDGNRIPAVFVAPNGANGPSTKRKLYMESSVGEDPNWGHTTSRYFPLNKWIQVEVKQYWSAKFRAYYRKYVIDRMQGKLIVNTDPKVYKNVDVLIGGPSNSQDVVQEGRIDNIKIVSGKRLIVVFQLGHMKNSLFPVTACITFGKCIKNFFLFC